MHFLMTFYIHTLHDIHYGYLFRFTSWSTTTDLQIATHPTCNACTYLHISHLSLKCRTKLGAPVIQAGISRSATTVIAWLMSEEGLSFEEALTDVISRRDCATPNRGFCDQLTILQNLCGRLENYTPEMFKVSCVST